jgi:WD40 repeat protein
MTIPTSTLAFWGNNLIALISKRSVSLWGGKDGLKRIRIIYPLDKSCFDSAAFSPDGRHLATASTAIHVWEVATGRLTLTMEPGSDPWTVAYSRDGKRLISVGRFDTPRLLNAESGHCEREFSLPDKNVSFRPLAMSYRDKLLAAGGEKSGKIIVWDAVQGTHLLSLDDDGGGRGPIHALEFARGDSQLIPASGDSVCVWSAATGIQLQRFRAHADTIYSISISHDGSQLATASEVNTVKIWDITQGRAVWAAVFSHDGEKLATCCDGGTVRVWDLATGKHQVLLQGEGTPVYAVAFAHSCSSMAVASGDGRVLVRRIDGTSTTHTLHGHRSDVWAVAYASDDHRLASTAGDRTVRV